MKWWSSIKMIKANLATNKNSQFFEKMLLYCLLPYWNAIKKMW